MSLDRSTMFFDMRPGESLVLPGDVALQFVQKSGRAARLRITAPRDVPITKKPEELGGPDTSVAELHRG